LEEEKKEDRPEYAWMRDFVRSRGAELRQRFGAHSIGVGRKRIGGRRTDDLAVIFYVTAKAAGVEPVPATISYTPPGHDQPVELLTDVVEAPPVTAEPE
jgi:hypothetical protein